MYNVYKIVNKINGNVYVGRTIHSLNTRWKGHLKCLSRGDSRHLYCAMRLYGLENFHIELLEACNSYDEMVLKEAHYCEKLNAYTHGYNMTTAGEINPMECQISKASHDAKMRSDDVRNKISNTMRSIRKSEVTLQMHKDDQSRRVKHYDVSKMLQEGWKQGPPGSKISFYDGVHVLAFSDDGVVKILPDQMPEYKKIGYKFSPFYFPKSSKILASHNFITVDNLNEDSIKIKRIRMHKDGKETTIDAHLLDQYLKDGWSKGGKPGRLSDKHKAALAASHKGMFDDEFKYQQSLRLKAFYENNPDRNTKSYHSVTICNPNNANELYTYKSCKHFCAETGLPSSVAYSGQVGRWVQAGAIKRRNFIYDGWNIYYTNT